jgi:hypothetical protein
MRRFLQKLRKKPKSTRRKIAFGTSASITSAIFAIWLTVVLASGGIGVTADSRSQNQAASPLGALGANAGSAITEVRERLSSSNTSSSSSATTSAKDIQKASEQPAQPSQQPAGGQSYWDTGATEKKSAEVEENGSSQQPSKSEGQTVDNQPYWKANDSNKDNPVDDTPPSEVGKDFWQDSNEEKSDNRWF